MISDAPAPFFQAEELGLQLQGLPDPEPVDGGADDLALAVGEHPEASLQDLALLVARQGVEQHLPELGLAVEDDADAAHAPVGFCQVGDGRPVDVGVPPVVQGRGLERGHGVRLGVVQAQGLVGQVVGKDRAHDPGTRTGWTRPRFSPLTSYTNRLVYTVYSPLMYSRIEEMVSASRVDISCCDNILRNADVKAHQRQSLARS